MEQDTWLSKSAARKASVEVQTDDSNLFDPLKFLAPMSPMREGWQGPNLDDNV